MQSHSDLQRKLEQTEQEHTFATENAERLRTAMDSRAAEIQALEDERQAHFAELDSLHSRLSTLDKEHARQLAERARQISDLETQLQLMHTESERTMRMVNESAERDVYLASVEDKAEQRREESERLRRRCHELEQESAAREVKLLELSKDADRVREDNMNLNIALDSKQQELELVSSFVLKRIRSCTNPYLVEEKARSQGNWWCHSRTIKNDGIWDNTPTAHRFKQDT